MGATGWTPDPTIREPPPDVRRYLRVLRRDGWLIGLSVAIALAAAMVVTVLQTPMYRASMTIVVGQGGGVFQPQFGGTVQPFVQTMASLFTSDVTARTTISDLRLHSSPTQLLAATQVSTTPDNSVLAVTYDAPQPAEAVRVLGRMGAVFTALVNQKLDASPGAGQQVTATVFDPAHLEPGRVSPRPAQNLAFSAAIGLAIGIAVLFLRLRLDNRIWTERDAEQWFGAPVLGAFPEHGDDTPNGRMDGQAATRAFGSQGHLDVPAEGLRYLRTSMGGSVATITSAAAAEGRTTLAARLALDLALAGHTVICVQADLHRPDLPAPLAAAKSRSTAQRRRRSPHGLAEVLTGHTPLDDALLDVPIPAATNGRSHLPSGQLQVLVPGRLRGSAAELLTNARVEQLLAELRDRAEYVIFDTPPLLDATDAVPFVRVSDDVIVVAREGQTTRAAAAAVRRSLERMEIGRVGVVLVGG